MATFVFCPHFWWGPCCSSVLVGYVAPSVLSNVYIHDITRTYLLLMYPVKHIEKGGSKLHNFISIYNYLIILKLPVSPIKQASSVCVIYMFYHYCEISSSVSCLSSVLMSLLLYINLAEYQHYS